MVAEHPLPGARGARPGQSMTPPSAVGPARVPDWVEHQRGTARDTWIAVTSRPWSSAQVPQGEQVERAGRPTGRALSTKRSPVSDSSLARTPRSTQQPGAGRGIPEVLPPQSDHLVAQSIHAEPGAVDPVTNAPALAPTTRLGAKSAWSSARSAPAWA